MSLPCVEVLVITKHDVEKLINYEDALAAAEIAFRAQGTGQLVQPDSTCLFVDYPDNAKLLLSMSSYVKPIQVAGIKWTNAYFGIRKSGIPSIWGGLIILNDPETGIPYSIIEATTITHMRTAGGHAALAAKYLAKKDSRTMAIIGCGNEGRVGLLAFSELFSIEIVKVYDTDSNAIASFLKEISQQSSVKIISVENAEDAFIDADIILMATGSKKPILLEPSVPVGCFVVGLSKFKDITPMLSWKVDKWIIGNRITDSEFNIPDIGLSYDYVYADMGEIVNGTKFGRENEQERILYTHMGMGAHDIALGHIIYSKAKERGIGKKVKLI